MKLNSRVTWGLAWAGLALVIAVPSADMVAAQFSSKQALVIDEAPAKAAPAVKQAALVAPVPAARPASRNQVAAAKPAAPAETVVASNSNDAVDRFISSGKQLPSYLTGGGETVAQAPAKPVVQQPQPAQVAATSPDKPVTWGESKWATPGGKNPLGTLGSQAAPDTIKPVTSVASLAPQPELVAPVPMPASMRPKVAVRPAPSVGIDPTTVASFDNGERVTARDLKDWESGPLSEFLAKRQQGRQIAQQPQRQPQYDPRYDPQADGDFIEYDNSPQYIGPVNNGSFLVWN